jgi:hypothetical protein
LILSYLVEFSWREVGTDRKPREFQNDVMTTISHLLLKKLSVPGILFACSKMCSWSFAGSTTASVAFSSITGGSGLVWSDLVWSGLIFRGAWCYRPCRWLVYTPLLETDADGRQYRTAGGHPPVTFAIASRETDGVRVSVCPSFTIASGGPSSSGEPTAAAMWDEIKKVDASRPVQSVHRWIQTPGTPCSLC